MNLHYIIFLAINTTMWTTYNKTSNKKSEPLQHQKLGKSLKTMLFMDLFSRF
jgi:hypothetical protein